MERFSDLSCEYFVKSDGEKLATFTGIASTSDRDHHNDIIAVGAFDPIATRRGPDGVHIPNVLMLRDHERSEVIGGWRSFTQNGNQLQVEGELTLEVAKARETYALLKKGYLSGLSVGFSVMRPQDLEYDEKTGRRTIKKATLRECSIVGFPANDRARVQNVKSELAARLQESGLDEADLILQLLLALKEGREPKLPDKDRKFRDSLIKAIDDFKPIDDVQTAADTLRGVLTTMKGRCHV